MKTHDTTICKEYRVEADPRHDNKPGYVAAFSIPGKDKQLARNDDGSIALFDTEDAAIAAAGEDLCEAMNARTISTANSFGYRVMGGAELAVALKELGLSPASFALYCGSTHDRIMDHIDGKTPIPRTMNLIAHLLRLPGAIEAAQRLTDEITFKKKDARPIDPPRPVEVVTKRRIR
jgi:hypothetical protein